ncbi:MAG: BREX-1 system phosphatase PglZ type B [Lentisphaeria bacterium]|jgi:hypothetical protein
MRVLDHLREAVRAAAVYNASVQVAPACILWPDGDRQWEAVMPQLQAELPELMVLGDYAPEQRRGPAIWLRCVIAGAVETATAGKAGESRTNPSPKTGAQSSSSVVPILYLPGVSRQDLRAILSLPEELMALAELQYRGVIWSQINAKDWTILAWLKSEQGGLGLDVALDDDSKNAMQLALSRLLDEDLSLLQGRYLDKNYFNTLLTGGDPTRDLLRWLDHGEAFRASRDENAWQAFVAICKSQLSFNPQSEGALAGALRLAKHDGPWHGVWQRYCEAPQLYPNIPAQLRKCQPPSDTILWRMGDASFDGWPQCNEEQENNLRRDLLTLVKLPPHKAGTHIKELERQHGRRRSLVWAALGDAPLANALAHLATVAELSANTLAAGTLDDLTAGYRNYGWQIDDAVVRALAHVDGPADVDAVSTAIRAVYLPWLDESARHLQQIWESSGMMPPAANNDCAAGECILFVDGLRFDCAKRLADELAKRGFQLEETTAWAALPSVTGTGKAAVAPINTSSDRVQEPDGYNFELMAAYHLRKAIEENGYVVLDKKSPCPPPASVKQRAWDEFGDIDHEGHERGWKLARHIDSIIQEVANRVAEILAAGWQRVRVVTDHGWLLLPGGLPKIDLPSVLADTKWSRCAALKPGASTDERLYPWYWHPYLHFALAEGVSCYKKSQEYCHGGLSLQECLKLHLSVEPGKSSQRLASVRITDVVWKRLRCTVAADGDFAGLALDVRRQAGDASTSVVVARKALKSNGTASVVVEDEDMEGREASVVLIDADGALIAQAQTCIGTETTTDDHE